MCAPFLSLRAVIVNVSLYHFVHHVTVCTVCSPCAGRRQSLFSRHRLGKLLQWWLSGDEWRLLTLAVIFKIILFLSKQLEDFYAHFISWSTVPSVSPISARHVAYRPRRLDLQLNALIVSKVSQHLCQIMLAFLFLAFLCYFCSLHPSGCICWASTTQYNEETQK